MWSLYGAIITPVQSLGADGVNPFRTGVPFWGQTSWVLGGLSPKWDRSSKRVNEWQCAE